jgi:RNA-splicing ligase RtcB
LFLHSGSRGVDNKIASHHIMVTQEQMIRVTGTASDRPTAAPADPPYRNGPQAGGVSSAAALPRRQKIHPTVQCAVAGSVSEP